MQRLVAITGTDDTGVKAAEDEGLAEEILKERQDPRMVDGLVEHFVEDG